MRAGRRPVAWVSRIVLWALMAVLISVVVFALALLLLYLTDGLSEQSPVGAVIAGLVAFPVSFVVIAAISVRRADQRRLELLHGRAVRGRP